MLSFLTKRSRLGLVVATTVTFAATGAGGYHYVENDEGSKRSLTFWRRIFPVFVQYRTVQFLNESVNVIDDAKASALYEELHNKHTDEVKAIVYDMRGFYLKQAQVRK